MPKTPEKYDWNSIDVGNNQLDHSQNFFSRKHEEHDRSYTMQLLQQAMLKTELNQSADEDLFIENKENVAKFSSTLKVENVQNFTSSAVNTHEHQLESKENISPVKVEKDTHDKEAKVEAMPLSAKIYSSFSTKKTTGLTTAKGAISKAIPPPPQAYLVKDIYRRKREEAERRRVEEERKKREFHSRPAPNFTVHHEQLQKQKPVHAITVAVTPQVLKTSREAEEKRRKRLEDWKLKNQPPKFKPRPLTILTEKPFVPEKKPTVSYQCPFNLNTEKRLRARKQYDLEKQKSNEEKQKQEEEERKKREEERIKELRKASTFKARPNPFKK